MAWARRHVAADGTESFRGYYRDPDGRTRSAGTFTSTRAAMRAANKEQGKVGDGTWLDPVLGKITFGTSWRTSGSPVGTWRPRPRSPTGPTSTSTSCPPSGPDR